MEADLMTSTNFYFLNQNFEVIHKLTQYESLMWVDKYDEPGNFEIYAPPTPEIKEAAQVNNYFRSDKSEHLMIIEKLETTVSPDDGERLVISGRSLESILDRRVLFMKCYFRDKNSEATPSSSTTVGADNLEDAIRQLLEYLFISPVHWDNETGTWVEATDRKVSNFVFQYTNEEEISSIVLKDCEFDKGENALNIVNKIVKQAGLGYKITLNSSNQFVFRLIKGVNRCTDQTSNPAVIFSTKFNNLKSSKFTDDFGENFKNFVYTEGETYKSQKPTIVETGEATGLLRREVYVNSSVQHETESSNVTHSGITKEKKKLTEEEYQAALKEDAEKYYKKYASKTTLESEIEPRLTFQYGRDFAIGDILEVQDGTGNTGKVRCIEFIISHSHSGYEEYPTFESYKDPEEEEPAQATASGGEFTDEGKKSNDELIAEAVAKALEEIKTHIPSHVGQIIESTVLATEADVKALYGDNTHWIQHSGYMLRGATSGVKSGSTGQANDGGADSVSVSSVASHNHTQNAHTHYMVVNTSSNDHNYKSPNRRIAVACWNGDYNHTYYLSLTSLTANSGLTGATTPTNIANGATYSVATLPKYKNVYIWERTA